MHPITIVAAYFLLVSSYASVLNPRDDIYDDVDDSFNIFKHSAERYEGAICRESITLQKFPNLLLPPGKSGCVRYFQGIDVTGVVTEVDLYFPLIQSACDCVAQCLSSPISCTNWVFKHTFVPAKDSGRRSCTLYSSPNLPTNVTLVYDLHNKTGLGFSEGFQLLQAGNNPQAGGEAPLTFLDTANTKPDPFGVSGFLSQDQNGHLYC